MPASMIRLGLAAIILTPSGTAAPRPSANPSSTADVCPPQDDSIRVRARDISTDASVPLMLQWALPPASVDVIRVDELLEAIGPGPGRIVSFLPNRLWLDNRCVYSVRSDSYRLAEGERWVEYDPEKPPASVAILSAGETRDSRSVEISLAQFPQGSRLTICRAATQKLKRWCDWFVDSSRRIYAIRYLKSPDTFGGRLGILQNG